MSSSPSPSTPVSQATTRVLSPTPALRRGRAFVGSPPGLNSPKTPKTPMKVQSPKTPVLPMKVMSPKTPKSHKSGRASSSSFVTPMKATRKTMLKLTPPKCTKGSQVVMKKPSGCQMVLKKPAAAKMSNKEKKARFENVMCKISSDWDEVKAHNKSYRSPPPCKWSVFLEHEVFLFLGQWHASEF